MFVPNGFAHVLGRISVPGDNEEMAITYGVEGNAGLDQAAVDFLSSETGDFLTGVMGNVYRFEGVVVTIGQSGADLILTSEDGAAQGTQGANLLPQNCSALFKKSTGVGGRKNRGRFYVPGIAEALVGDTGVLSAGAITQFQGQADDFLGDLNTALLPMVVLHTSPLDTPTTVTALTIDTRIATQRRRLR
jgi:hypothetical protein